MGVMGADRLGQEYGALGLSPVGHPRWQPVFVGLEVLAQSCRARLGSTER